MKEISRQGKTENITEAKKSTTNLFLNLIIFFLVIVVAFLSVSIVKKIKSNSSKNVRVENNNVPAAIIQLEVLNGCGVAGAAEKITDYLRNNRVDVVQMKNYSSFDIEKSLVIDRTGNKLNAEKIADILGIDKKYIVQQISNDYFLDVSLVIGKDYNQLKSNTK
ncbi:MAG: LytR C-terminal domain-containing protein [Ignavibacteriaceae bacterium]|nr:LytR C-terminal domain-containing protein [Ignavibacteriaceae bacterium]